MKKIKKLNLAQIGHFFSVNEKYPENEEYNEIN